MGLQFDRQRHVPVAGIHAWRFAGSDSSHILNRIEINSFPMPGVENAEHGGFS